MVGWQLRSPCFKGAAYGLDFGLRVAASGYRCCGGLGVGCSKVVSICFCHTYGPPKNRKKELMYILG